MDTFLKFRLFLEQCNVHRKTGEKVPRCLIYPLPPTYIASLSINILHQSGIFIKIDESAMTHGHHPESIVYIRVHSWCCT